MQARCNLWLELIVHAVGFKFVRRAVLLKSRRRNRANREAVVVLAESLPVTACQRSQLAWLRTVAPVPIDPIVQPCVQEEVTTPKERRILRTQQHLCKSASCASCHRIHRHVTDCGMPSAGSWHHQRRQLQLRSLFPAWLFRHHVFFFPGPCNRVLQTVGRCIYRERAATPACSYRACAAAATWVG